MLGSDRVPRMMDSSFTPEELHLVSDTHFFRAKAEIMNKVRVMLDLLYATLEENLRGVELLVPPDFDPAAHQFVKGEHLEDFPYQYLDYFKYFAGDTKFTFRSLFWWGHHIVFALILEGGYLSQYKANLMNRYGGVADQGLVLCLGSTPWEWKRGEGYTMELTWERKNELQALLDRRSFVKLARFVSFDDPVVREGRLATLGSTTLRQILPIVTP
jgi:hypothetical protein